MNYKKTTLVLIPKPYKLYNNGLPSQLLKIVNLVSILASTEVFFTCSYSTLHLLHRI